MIGAVFSTRMTMIDFIVLRAPCSRRKLLRRSNSGPLSWTTHGPLKRKPFRATGSTTFTSAIGRSRRLATEAGDLISPMMRCWSSNMNVNPFGDKFGEPSEQVVARNPSRCCDTSVFISSLIEAITLHQRVLPEKFRSISERQQWAASSTGRRNTSTKSFSR